MKVGAIILAGGNSSRMGKDKGLLFLNGKPMVAHIINTLQQITDDILIVSNNIEYNNFGVKVYPDLIKDAGPLAGIYSGLSHAKFDKNIVVSCDVPFISVELLNYLIENSKNFDVTIPVKNDKAQRVIGIYDKNCIPTFKNELENNQRRIKFAIQKLNSNLINADQFKERVFTNINTPNELKEIQ